MSIFTTKQDLAAALGTVSDPCQCMSVCQCEQTMHQAGAHVTTQTCGSAACDSDVCMYDVTAC